MLRTPEEMKATTHDLNCSMWTIGAIAAIFESGLADELREPRTVAELAERRSIPHRRVEKLLDLAAVAGVVVAEGEKHRLADGAMPFLAPPARASFEGDLRTTLLQVLALVDGTRPGMKPGWAHTDRALLQTQGDASGMLPPMLKNRIVPTLGDLAQRLEQPGARFLDVGVGVGALAIGMCRVYPALSVVGLDTFEVPLAIARENVAKAGLGDRIELRKALLGDLADEAAYDFVWVPTFFVTSIERDIAAVHRATKPGGWVLLGVDAPTKEPRERAVWNLINDTWGGAGIAPAAAEEMLRKTGFSQVRTLPGPPWAPGFVVGQR